MGTPFDRWHELEQTYQYAHRFKPELFGLALSVAHQKMEESLNRVEGKIVNEDAAHSLKKNI